MDLRARRWARSCMLYTDLANPTSNKIYAEIGYRRVGDWEEHEFKSAPEYPAHPGRPAGSSAMKRRTDYR